MLGRVTMGKRVMNYIGWLAIGLMLPSTMLLASTAELDQAVKTYYAGQPAQAVKMITPLAQSGDVDAQYLLGNILYSLSKNEHASMMDDAVDWYKKAAEQDSARASNALGVIYYNRWIESRQQQDAALSISYYRKAISLGAKVAQEPLIKLEKLSGVAADQVVAMAGETVRKEAPVEQTTVKAELQKAIPTAIVETDVATEREESEVISEALEPEEIAPKSEEKLTELLAEPVGAVEQEIVLQREQPPRTLTLVQLANECGNYTEVGFGVYADSINGAIAVGNAKVRKLDSNVLRLEMKNTAVAVLLNLKGVPDNLVRDLQPGDNFTVQGVIVQSQLANSACTVHLQYNIPAN